MSEVIVVTSGKGGVGKTTTTANIGTGLAKLGKKVVMIDTDTGLRNLDVVLGLENRIVYNLVDVVEGNCRLKQAMIADKRCPKLFLLPTAQTRDKSAVTPEQMVKVIDEIKNDPEGFDYIILDCPAGIEQGFQNAIMPIRRELLTLRSYYDEIMDMGKQLEENENGFFAKKQVKYFGVISDRADRLMSKASQLLEYAQQVRDAYKAQVDAQQNNNMQFLTVISTIFFPLTLITSWYGMNFHNMPELKHGYPGVIILSVVVMITCIIIFKRKKML